MVRVVVLSDMLEIIYWVLVDNLVVLVIREELKEVLKLVG